MRSKACALAIAFISSCSSANAQQEYVPYRVATIAGVGNSSGSLDGPVSVAQFFGPTDVGIDQAGNTYVVDSENDTIRKIAADGTVTTLAGAPGQTGSADGAGLSARFNNPTGLAVDKTGDVYVADSGNDTIREISPDGTVNTIAGSPGTAGSADGTVRTARFSFPTHLVVDALGAVYVSDEHNHTIRKISTSGFVTTVAGSAGQPGASDGAGSSARFNLPDSLAIDLQGNIVIADSGNDLVRRLSPEGTVTTIAGLVGQAGSDNGTTTAAKFNNPNGVAVDSSGDIFVADSGNNAIREITPSGAVSTFAGLSQAYGLYQDGIGGAARFAFPAGVAIDQSGNLLVADYYNNSIRKITPIANVTTYAGTPTPAGHHDGIGALARFVNPIGIAVSAAGTAYIADPTDDTIRKIEPDGSTTTLAGSPGSPGSNDGIGTAARLNRPWGIALDNLGNVFVADTDNETIRKISSDGTVTTVAGSPGKFGTVDGPALSARFNSPRGIAFDQFGNLYIADSTTAVIRRLSPDGIVTTIAGMASDPGSADGPGTDSQFNLPSGIAVDGAGNIYVADTGNDEIRRIASNGTVSTVSGLAPPPGVLSTGAPPNSGEIDGSESVARFYAPTGIAIDSLRNIFVADAGNNVIRRISSSGQVVTLAGSPGVAAWVDGIGSAARLNAPSGIAVAPDGSLWIADTGNHAIRQAVALPEFISNPTSGTIPAGRSAILSVNAANGVTSYQWYLNGVPIDGATASTLILNGVSEADAGSYVCEATNSQGTTTSVPATIAVAASDSSPGFIGNASGLGYVGTGAQAIVGGCVLGGLGPKQILVRGIGPGLKSFGINSQVVTNPQLTIYGDSGLVMAQGSAWEGLPALISMFGQVGAFPLDLHSSDAALVVPMDSKPIGAFTAQLGANAGAPGVGLIEFYDISVDPTESRITNASVRGQVSTTQSIVGGFVTRGDTAETVLVRAIGPGLKPYGVQDSVDTLVLTVFDEAGNVIATNSTWSQPPGAGSSRSVIGISAASSSIFHSAGAFPLNRGSSDAAIVLTLPTGSYTAQVGTAGAAGSAMFEVYELP